MLAAPLTSGEDGTMTLRILSRVAGPALLGCVTLGACSNGPPPTPAAFVNSWLVPGNNGAQCNTQTRRDQLALGTATSVTTATALPTVTSDGGMDRGVQAGVKCSVSGSGGNFNVVLIAQLGGQSSNSPPAGSLEITGTVTTSGGSNLTLQGLGFEQATWSGTGCTVAYTYQGAMINTNGGPVAPGRIWGHLVCPQVQEAGGTMLVNGMDVPVTCKFEADFLFENCSQ